MKLTKVSAIVIPMPPVVGLEIPVRIFFIASTQIFLYLLIGLKTFLLLALLFYFSAGIISATAAIWDDRTLLKLITWISGRRIKYSFHIIILKQIALVLGWFLFYISLSVNPAMMLIIFEPITFFFGIAFLLFGYI